VKDYKTILKLCKNTKEVRHIDKYFIEFKNIYTKFEQLLIKDEIKDRIAVLKLTS
jgi:hypothetical protein